MKISEKLKLLRKTENYTQQNLANILNTTVISIQNYENERSKPTGDILQKLCQHHPEYTLWLMTGNTSGDQISPDMKAIAISNNTVNV